MPSIKELKQYRTENLDDAFVHKCIVDVYKVIGLWVAKLFLHTPITANQITALMGLIAIIVGVFLSMGELWMFIVGIVLFIFASILDRVDGVVARYRNNITIVGKYIDDFSHYILIISLDMGLVLYVYHNIMNSIILLIGTGMVLFEILIKLTNFSYTKVMYEKLKEDVNRKSSSKSKKRKSIKHKSLGIFSRPFVREINALISSNAIIIYWVLIGGILDHFTSGISVYSFNISYLTLLIIILTSARLFRFIATVLFFYFKLNRE